MLVDASPRIGPVIVDLAPQHVPPDSPHVLIFSELREVVVSHGYVVDVLHLEGNMVETGPFMPQAEEDVMVDIGFPAITPIERPYQVVRFAGIDIIGADEAQCLAEPLNRLLELRGHEHAMTDP